MREIVGAVLGVYINIRRLAKDWQQVFMYGVKIKPGFERFFLPKHRPPVQPYLFDVARQLEESNEGKPAEAGPETAGPEEAGPEEAEEAVFSQVDSGGILINYTLMFTRCRFHQYFMSSFFIQTFFVQLFMCLQFGKRIMAQKLLIKSW